MAKKSQKTPVQPIRVYLLKTSVKKYRDALREKVHFEEFSLKPGLGLTGNLFIRKPQKRKAEWADFLQQGVAKNLPDLRSTPHAAVLFLTVDGRIFALVFGMGRYLLDDSAY